jgi:hypothetical protein
MSRIVVLAAVLMGFGVAAGFTIANAPSHALVADAEH